MCLSRLISAGCVASKSEKDSHAVREQEDKAMEQTEYSEDVTATVDMMAEEIWKILFSLGPIRKEVAYSQSVAGLFKVGLITDPAPQPDSDAHELIEMAFKTALEYGFLDTPEDNSYRAVLTNAEDFEESDWRMCLLNAMEEKPMSRDEAISATANWAIRNVGLNVKSLTKDDVVWKYLDSAINGAVRDKIMKQTIFYGIEKLQVLD